MELMDTRVTSRQTRLNWELQTTAIACRPRRTPAVHWDGHPSSARVEMAALGYPVGMERQGVPEDVPIADAAEQNRDAIEHPLEDDALEPTATDVPLEASPADWQEQTEMVDLDPYLEESDRER
jgi:hypothetical protein